MKPCFLLYHTSFFLGFCFVLASLYQILLTLFYINRQSFASSYNFRNKFLVRILPIIRFGTLATIETATGWPLMHTDY